MKIYEGKVRLELCDPITGKVKERVEGKNTFTNALDSAINKCPYGLSNGAFGTPSLNGNAQTITPLPSTGLGGALLFPNFTNPNDMDDLYEPLSNPPVAYSSVLNPNLDDSKLGVFNQQESGNIEENGKVVGYKFVHDWLTSTGNGTIGAIALSNRYCNYYFDNHAYFNLAGAGSGYIRNIGTNHAVHRVTATHWAASNPQTNVVTVYKMTYSDVPLTLDYASMLPEKVFEVEAGASVSIALDNDYLYTIQTNGGASASIVIKKYDITDGSLVSTDTISVVTTTPLLPTTRDGIADTYTQVSEYYDIKDGYLYGMCGSQAGSPITRNVTAIAKIQISNSANVTEIPLSRTIRGYRSNCFIGHDSENVYVRGHSEGTVAVIGNDNVAIMTNGTSTAVDGMTVLGEYGVWRILGRSETQLIGASIFAPYLATKYTLDSLVTKTADKTMKLSYSVRQV